MMSRQPLNVRDGRLVSVFYCTHSYGFQYWKRFFIRDAASSGLAQVELRLGTQIPDIPRNYLYAQDSKLG